MAMASSSPDDAALLVLRHLVALEQNTDGQVVVLCETKASAPERVALGLTATLVHARAELNVRRSVPTTSSVR